MAELITLTDDDRHLAEQEAQRWMEKPEPHWAPKMDRDRDVTRWRNVFGAEIAAAKAYGHEWRSREMLKDASFGSTFKVCWRSKFTWNLTLTPRDTDAYTYVLVSGEFPTYQVRGHIHGTAAKNEKYIKQIATFNNGAPTYFVPNEALQPPIQPPSPEKK